MTHGNIELIVEVLIIAFIALWICSAYFWWRD